MLIHSFTSWPKSTDVYTLMSILLFLVVWCVSSFFVKNDYCKLHNRIRINRKFLYVDLKSLQFSLLLILCWYFIFYCYLHCFIKFIRINIKKIVDKFWNELVRHTNLFEYKRDKSFVDHLHNFFLVIWFVKINSKI